MKFMVAIKIEDYTEQFSFDTEEERNEFIENSKKMHPVIEFLLSEESEWSSAFAKYAYSA